MTRQCRTQSSPTGAPRAVQELQKAGASLFSFHLEALWGGRGGAEGGWPREQRVVELAARVRRCGMAAGLALVPGTPAEAAAPYAAAGDIDVARPRAHAVGSAAQPRSGPRSGRRHTYLPL